MAKKVTGEEIFGRGDWTWKSVWTRTEGGIGKEKVTTMKWFLFPATFPRNKASRSLRPCSFLDEKDPLRLFFFPGSWLHVLCSWSDSPESAYSLFPSILSLSNFFANKRTLPQDVDPSFSTYFTMLSCALYLCLSPLLAQKLF